MVTASLICGLRFIDSFFPSGGFAYSSGLEAAVQGGKVRTGADLSQYVEDLLRNGMASREGVAVGVAWDAARAAHLSSLVQIDQELDSMKLGRESRLASRQMGRQVLRIAKDTIACPAVFSQFWAKADAGETPGHLPVALGLTLGVCGWTKGDAIAAYLYQTAVGLVSAAMKLLPIGQREGQQLLESRLPDIVRLSQGACEASAMRSWSPVQDIYAMRHSRLVSRLFRS